MFQNVEVNSCRKERMGLRSWINIREPIGALDPGGLDEDKGDSCGVVVGVKDGHLGLDVVVSITLGFTSAFGPVYYHSPKKRKETHGTQPPSLVSLVKTTLKETLNIYLSLAILSSLSLVRLGFDLDLVSLSSRS